MRVFITPPRVESRSIGRIASELQRYAPTHIEFVRRREDADLVVLHVIGRRDQMLRAAAQCRERKQAYVVNQYCLRSTQKPYTSDWFSLWSDARCVWSYYDLPQWVADDQNTFSFHNFYHSPLGADASVFTARKPDTPPFLIGMTGYTPGIECLHEVVDAVYNIRIRHGEGHIFHLGTPLTFGMQFTTSATNITDRELAQSYANCRYLSALRRIEGFELPAAEALLSGTRPIMFDRPHYRQWFAGHAVFISELDSRSVTAQLCEVLETRPTSVLADERAFLAERFNWRTIAQEYWRRCL